MRIALRRSLAVRLAKILLYQNKAQEDNVLLIGGGYKLEIGGGYFLSIGGGTINSNFTNVSKA